MANNDSSIERRLEGEHFKTLPVLFLAGLNSVMTCFYDTFKSWCSVVNFCYKSSLEKMSISEWRYPENWYSLQEMFFVTLIAAIIVSALVMFTNYYKKRRTNVLREPIRNSTVKIVNCWFCHTDTFVLYVLQETWTCPTCDQYNGFKEDGSYNKPIQAQYMEILNPSNYCRPAEGYQLKENSNGLCSQCNLNQVIKARQLASFVAVNEQNYDAEIEAEEKRLEKVYKICARCEFIVKAALKRTPDKVKKRNFRMRASSAPPRALH